MQVTTPEYVRSRGRVHIDDAAREYLGILDDTATVDLTVRVLAPETYRGTSFETRRDVAATGSFSLPRDKLRDHGLYDVVFESDQDVIVELTVTHRGD